MREHLFLISPDPRLPLKTLGGIRGGRSSTLLYPALTIPEMYIVETGPEALVLAEMLLCVLFRISR